MSAQRLIRQLTRGALVLLLGAAGIFSSPPVYACSGGHPPTLRDVVEPAQIAVKAQVIQTDEASLNGILRVETYLFGGPGPEYLLLQQRNPADFLYLYENRGGSGGCATPGPRLTAVGWRYLFLIRNADGTYRNSLIPTQFNNGWLHYPLSDDATMTINEQTGDDGGYQQRDVTEAEFVALVQQYREATATPPVPDAPYPLPAPLLLETDTGQQFILPVDGDPAYAPEQPLWRSHRRRLGQYVEGITACASDCTIVSADGTAPAVKSGAQIQWGTPGTVTAGEATGEAFMLSPTNDLVAVWEGDSLAVHLMNNPRTGINLLHMQPRPVPYNAVPVDEPVYRAAWRHDGRTLAYSDKNGLWLWDVFAVGASPRLLLPAPPEGEIPYARYWSPGGRYLAIAEGSTHSTYDTIQQARLPDGIVSQDDRVLLAYDTRANGLTALRFCRLAPQQDCRTPFALDQVDSRYPPLWENATTWLISTCLENRGCLVLRDSTYLPAFSLTMPGTAFDYEPVTGTIATLDHNHTLHIYQPDTAPYQPRSYRIPGLDAHTLVALEWLPTPLITLHDAA